MALGIIMATAVDLHLELIHKHADASVWDLWLAIEAKRISKTAVCATRPGRPISAFSRGSTSPTATT